MKIICSLLNFCRRLLWVVLTIVNWLIYIPTFFAIIVLEFVFVILLPVIWLLGGKTVTEKMYDFVFMHSNENLWLVEGLDYYLPGMNFESMIPIHGKYIQEYINLILPKNDRT